MKQYKINSTVETKLISEYLTEKVSLPQLVKYLEGVPNKWFVAGFSYFKTSKG